MRLKTLNKAVLTYTGQNKDTTYEVRNVGPADYVCAEEGIEEPYPVEMHWRCELRVEYTFKPISEGFDMRQVLDEAGDVLGVIGPGGRSFKSPEDARTYRASLGERLAPCFFISAFIGVRFRVKDEGESYQDQDKIYSPTRPRHG